MKKHFFSYNSKPINFRYFEPPCSDNQQQQQQQHNFTVFTIISYFSCSPPSWTMSFSKLRRIGFGSVVGLAGMLPFGLDDPDKVNKSVKTAGDYYANRETVLESGPERIKRMFTLE